MLGCRTASPLPPVNLSEPGWRLQQGQAVWRSARNAPEIAGELLVARHPGGRTLLQFTKNPLPFVTVHTSGTTWEVEFVPQQRTVRGKGNPPARLLWVHLARALNGQPPAAPLRFAFTAPHEWKIENTDSGEFVSGFLGE